MFWRSDAELQVLVVEDLNELGGAGIACANAVHDEDDVLTTPGRCASAADGTRGWIGAGTQGDGLAPADGFRAGHLHGGDQVIGAGCEAVVADEFREFFHPRL